MRCAAAKAKLLHTGIFLAANCSHSSDPVSRGYPQTRRVTHQVASRPISGRSAQSSSAAVHPTLGGPIARAAKRVCSDGRPYPVVPEAPIGISRVPHQLSPRGPRRLRWLWGRPRRRGSPRPPARRAGRAAGMLPIVAAIPVPVQDAAPRRAPLIARAPVIRRGRCRLRTRAAGQSQNGQRQSAAHQHTRSPPQPRSRPLDSRHLPRISPDWDPGK